MHVCERQCVRACGLSYRVRVIERTKLLLLHHVTHMRTNSATEVCVCVCVGVRGGAGGEGGERCQILWSPGLPGCTHGASQRVRQEGADVLQQLLQLVPRGRLIGGLPGVVGQDLADEAHLAVRHLAVRHLAVGHPGLLPCNRASPNGPVRCHVSRYDPVQCRVSSCQPI